MNTSARADFGLAPSLRPSRGAARPRSHGRRNAESEGRRRAAAASATSEFLVAASDIAARDRANTRFRALAAMAEVLGRFQFHHPGATPNRGASCRAQSCARRCCGTAADAGHARSRRRRRLHGRHRHPGHARRVDLDHDRDRRRRLHPAQRPCRRDGQRCRCPISPRASARRRSLITCACWPSTRPSRKTRIRNRPRQDRHARTHAAPVRTHRAARRPQARFRCRCARWATTGADKLGKDAGRATTERRSGAGPSSSSATALVVATRRTGN